MAGADDPKFAPITPDDYGGVVAIIATLLMTGMLISLAIRIYVRISITKGLDVDDYVLTVASILAVGQTTATLVSVNRGFGKISELVHDDEARIVQMEKAIYASDVLLIIAITLSKCAVCLLVKRLTQTKQHQAVAYAVLAISVLWGFASTLAIGLRAPMDKPWQLIEADMPKVLLRWRVIGSFDISVEVALGLLPIFLVWNLQMPVKLKLIVVVAFSFRLTVIAAIIARNITLGTALNSASHDLFFALVPSTLCAQVEMHWGLMAATIPCLKPFMRATNTGCMGFGGTFIKRTQESQPLSSIRSKSGNKNSGIHDSSNTSRNKPGFLGGGGGAGWTTIVAAKDGEHRRRDGEVRAEDQNSVTTNSSEAGIIRQTVSWVVEYHENPADSDENGGRGRR